MFGLHNVERKQDILKKRSLDNRPDFCPPGTVTRIKSFNLHHWHRNSDETFVIEIYKSRSRKSACRMKTYSTSSFAAVHHSHKSSSWYVTHKAAGRKLKICGVERRSCMWMRTSSRYCESRKLSTSVGGIVLLSELLFCWWNHVYPIPAYSHWYLQRCKRRCMKKNILLWFGYQFASKEDGQ